MNFWFGSAGIQTLSRVAVLVSLTVALLGKTVHLQQECGCCASVTTSDARHTACPFGCDHYGDEEESGEQQSGSDHDHEESTCPICSLLAQSSETASIVDLPDAAHNVVGPVVQVSDLPLEGSKFTVRSRGPPIAAMA